MRHPVTLIRQYDNDVQNGKYSQIGRKEAGKWEARKADMNSYDYAKAMVSCIGHLWATKARLIDKIALYKTIIARGAGYDEGSISDDDALMILAGWACEMRNRR